MIGAVSERLGEEEWDTEHGPLQGTRKHCVANKEVEASLVHGITEIPPAVTARKRHVLGTSTRDRV